MDNMNKTFSITGATLDTHAFGLFIACGYTPSQVNVLMPGAAKTAVMALIPTDGTTAISEMSIILAAAVATNVERYLGAKSIAASTDHPAYFKQVAGVTRFYNSVGTILNANYIHCVVDAEGNEIAYSSTNPSFPKEGRISKGVLIGTGLFEDGIVTVITLLP